MVTKNWVHDNMDVKAISMCNANKELMSLTLIVNALRVIDIVSSVEDSRSRYYSNRKLIRTYSSHKIELNHGTCIIKFKYF